MAEGIILLTKHFPFNNGETPAETYLENEISLLCKNANRVFVIATEATEGSKITCKLPENADCIALQTKKQRVVKSACVAKALPMLLSAKLPEVKAEAKVLGLKKKLFLNYFVKRAEQKLSRIDRAVTSGRLNPTDYDTIYSYWFFDNAYAAVKMRDKYHMKHTACVSRAHGYDLYEYANSLGYLPLRKYLFQKLDMVYACSQDGRDYLNQRFEGFSEKIQTSFLGCADCGVQEISRQKGRIRIASCSHIVPLKRVERIGECAAKLSEKGIEVEWTHMGGGALFEQLKERVKLLEGKVHVKLTGMISNTQIMENYRSSDFDVFVNASTREGIPISIMEAISFGIPVAATDVGGTHEIITHEKNGFLFDKDFSDDDLAGVLERICTMSDSDYQVLRENARNTFKEKFEFENNVNTFLSSIPR